MRFRSNDIANAIALNDDKERETKYVMIATKDKGRKQIAMRLSRPIVGRCNRCSRGGHDGWSRLLRGRRWRSEETHARRCHFSRQGRSRCTRDRLRGEERVRFPLRPRRQVRRRWLRDGRGGLGRRQCLRLRLLTALLTDIDSAPRRASRAVAGYALRRGWRFDGGWWRRLFKRWLPVGSVLAPGAVLRLHAHELCDLVLQLPALIP